MSRMADLDAALAGLGNRMVDHAAEAISSSVYGATARDWARARAAVAMALRELDAEVGRRLMAGEDHVDLAQLITYVEGGQVDVQ